METRKEKVIFSDAIINPTGKIFLPRSWMKKMDITRDDPDFLLSFEQNRMVIDKNCTPCSPAPLASNDRIWSFAMMALELFKNYKNHSWHFYFDTGIFPTAFTTLGFQMDCGQSAKEAFPDADIFHYEGLISILDKVTVPVLGSAIFFMVEILESL